MADAYDLIVVGAGTAGIPCAIEAATAGARVLLVEKSGRIGGTLHLSGGHLSGAGARRQRARGITDAAQDHYDDILRISRGTAPPALTRLAVEQAAATIDWLEDLGFPFAAETPRIVYGHEPYSTPRTYYGPDGGRSILAVLERALAPHLDSGTVELRLSTRVVRLLHRGQRVTGVAVEGAGVAELTAGATVLTTGGYGGAPELFARLHSAPLVTAAAETSTGDAIALTEQLGAQVVGADDFIPTFGGLPVGGEAPSRIDWSDRPLLVAEERTPWEIYVDRLGRRFVAEDLRSIDAKERALADVEDLTFFTIFDDRAVDQSSPMVAGWSAEQLRRRAGVRPGISVAGSLAALAEQAGIDVRGLSQTVAAYNRYVQRGHDPEFGRTALPAPIATPPFYAMRNHGVSLITFAGLAVDEQLRVLGAEGEPIEGLYAAGEALGAAAAMGNSFCSGMVITPALAFGRLLGARLGRSSHAPSDRS